MNNIISLKNTERDEGEDLCCKCKNLYFIGTWPYSVPFCRITRLYYKEFIPLHLSCWYSFIIVSCSEFKRK